MNKKINYILFGYRRLTVEEADAPKTVSILLRSGISATITEKHIFLIKESDVPKVVSSLKDFVEYNLSKPLGLMGFIKNNSKRYGILAALFLSAVLCFLSYNTVFDIRISGNESLSAEDVIEALDASGFSVGDLWSKCNKSEIEARLLSSSSNIAWININRRGNVAYIDIVEKKIYSDKELPYKYSNIVAECDCVIEDINVKSGYAAVKIGDTVKRGDVLISGIPPTENGDFCLAMGEVVGRVNERLEVVAEREIEEKINIREKYMGFKIKIFKIFINIFKIYRNSHSECGIIEREKQLNVYGDKIPISIVRTYSVEYELKKRLLSESELVSKASDEMALKMQNVLKDAELLRAKTSGAFYETGYKMTTEIIYLSSVGIQAPFEISE